METVSTVVVGGGIAGTAMAYYLAREGEQDIVLVEGATYGSGATAGSFGNVRQQFGTALEVEVRRGERSFPLALTAVRPPKGLGLEVLATALGLEAGRDRDGLVVATVARGSEAARAGLRPGDRLLGANGQRLADAEQLGREVLRSLDRGSLLLVVGRGRYAYNLNFPL